MIFQDVPPSMNQTVYFQIPGVFPFDVSVHV